MDTKKHVLILGGTRGLGRAIAQRTLQENMQPIVVGRGEMDPPLEGVVLIRGDLTHADTDIQIVGAINGQGLPFPEIICWVAGNYYRGPLEKQSHASIESMIATHALGPVLALQALHAEAKRQKKPYALVCIGSTLLYRPAKQHAVLSGLKGFKANFCRSYGYEISRDLPGSRVLLVNPWAMRTGFFQGSIPEETLRTFPDPADVAGVIFDELKLIPEAGSKPILEVNLEKDEPTPLLGPWSVSY